MWRTNLKILAVTLGVLAFYTMIANVIPQLQSEVPEALDLTGNASPEALVAAGEKIYNGAGGCTACHGLGTRAPNLLTDHAGQGPIGARCGTRERAWTARRICTSRLTQPSKFVVSGFEPIMPDMRRQLSDDQIWATGRVPAIARWGGDGHRRRHPEDGARAAAGGSGSVPPGGVAVTSTMDPSRCYNEKGCVGCHQLDGKGGAGRSSLRSHRRAPQRRTTSAAGSSCLTRTRRRASSSSRATMPQTFGQMLSAAQLEALVQFLASRK